MGARTNMMNNNSSSTTTEAAEHSSSKLSSWKARLTGTRRGSRGSSFGDADDLHASSSTTPRGAAPDERQDNVVKSLSSQRSKSKKNWRGSLRNLLPNKEKDGANPQTPVSADGTELATNRERDQQHLSKPTYSWPSDPEQQARAREMVMRKQLTKERDGFCRTVQIYDGQVLTVDGKPTYELGNYLGGGVAGVVYEGNRLLPSEEYPVRQGHVDEAPVKLIIQPQVQPRVSSFICGDTNAVDFGVDFGDQQRSTLTRDTTMSRKTTGGSSTLNSLEDPQSSTTGETINTNIEKMAMDVAIETTAESTDDRDNAVFVDRPDAPSRSKHTAKAAAAATSQSQLLIEETVAIKILNPVAFRIIAADATASAVVVKEGEPMPREVENGKLPMQGKHVWWLVNPNSRNLQTLQRYNTKRKDGGLKKTRDVDRGSPDRGLRLSLVAAYMDSRSQLRELPLTRCIEIWGHIPFDATDMEFEDMIESIERINAGHAPSPPPSRVPTYDSSTSDSYNETAAPKLADAIPMASAKTGLYRAAAEARATVFCESLNAFIAVPAVPPKYLRWLRQRRAATKEIRNMMLIGRHHNVVHLYEVLEYIQENKSTMFLILELVRGGELFDLISNNSNGGKRGIDVDSELRMRKFFRELSSGIHYCHANGIAHRDLKPENLLVHTGDKDTESTLKIADFGLSATFAINDDDTVRDSVASPSITPFGSPMRGDDTVTTLPTVDTTPARSNSFSSSFSHIGQHAIQLLTCGNIEDVNWCGPNTTLSTEALPSPLRRMTSVVGSPHYVAPEIILQTDTKDGRKKKNAVGYDGTKADVWSAGVILYAMLYRSLPFGEDLLRCPRYQSFRKWYNEARSFGGRRSSAIASLNPVITSEDEAEMLGPHWFFPSHTSAESRDLIVAMLNPNPTDRLSIEFVLQHPWLTKENLTLSSS